MFFSVHVFPLTCLSHPPSHHSLLLSMSQGSCISGTRDIHIKVENGVSLLSAIRCKLNMFVEKPCFTFLFKLILYQCWPFLAPFDHFLMLSPKTLFRKIHFHIYAFGKYDRIYIIPFFKFGSLEIRFIHFDWESDVRPRIVNFPRRGSQSLAGAIKRNQLNIFDCCSPEQKIYWTHCQTCTLLPVKVWITNLVFTLISLFLVALE